MECVVLMSLAENSFQVALIRPQMQAISNTQVHERSKVSRVLEQVAPFRVIACPRFSRDNFRQGLTQSFESCNSIADLHQDVSEQDQVGFASHCSVSGND